MKILFLSLVTLCCLLVSPNLLYSEGTKQIMPTSDSKGQLCINKTRNDFAFFSGSSEYRLNVSIAKTSEVIRFGFKKIVDSHSTNLVYRIKDPTGQIVSGPNPIPDFGDNGYINTYVEAIAGPFPASGGYNYLEIVPYKTGDYYFEFSYPESSPGIYSNDDRLFEFFDITVINANGKEVEGRVWSKAWQFWSLTWAGTENKFNGKMFIYSDDSIVTKVDCNGFRGGTFSFSCNKTGCNNTGDIVFDRMSRQGFHFYPQYKVFLNDPDSLLFPTQRLTSGNILEVSVVLGCNGGADFKIKMTNEGIIKILVKTNLPSGTQTEIFQKITNLTKGDNSIPWDGKDLNGNSVPNGTPLILSAINLNGMTHLPLYDIEYNDFGLIVKQIRPAGDQLKIYWDDSNLSGGTSNSATGCISPTGCHIWSNNTGADPWGNEKTINSWWFVTGSEISDQFFTSKRAPGQPVIIGNSTLCKGIGSLEFTATEPNSTSFTWNYSGTGVTITGTGLTRTLNFAPESTPGQLSVIGYNDDCGDGSPGFLDITIEPLPEVVLAPFPEICYTAPGFKLTGGQPEGGTYTVDGVVTDSLFPYKEPEGLHSIVYSYTNSLGCSNSTSADINLRTGDDCEGTAFFPTAFSPNGDDKNDKFKPQTQSINNFRMNIFNRWGQLIYTTNNSETGWDGTVKGKNCPVGLYVFTATYGLSLRSSDTATQRGTFALIR